MILKNQLFYQIKIRLEDKVSCCEILFSILDMEKAWQILGGRLADLNSLAIRCQLKDKSIEGIYSFFIAV